jgi:hypothetical protein
MPSIAIGRAPLARAADAAAAHPFAAIALLSALGLLASLLVAVDLGVPADAASILGVLR